jgi:hypothetical protein
MDIGTFLPSGLHLITDTATLKQKLSDHNEFLTNIENIPVVGLPPAAFSISAATNLERLIHESRLFTTVEITSASDRLGKHFFLTTKDKSDSELVEWAQEFIYPQYSTTRVERYSGLYWHLLQHTQVVFNKKQQSQKMETIIAKHRQFTARNGGRKFNYPSTKQHTQPSPTQLNARPPNQRKTLQKSQKLQPQLLSQIQQHQK